LVVGEPQAALAELLSQQPVLLSEVIHRLQLTLVHPPSHGDQKNRNGFKALDIWSIYHRRIAKI
jgi:hypothetical protein